jgi:CBS domain-containing protein
MFVESMLSVARKRPVTIGDDAPLIAAAKLPGIPHADLVVVCSCNEMLAGVITKTNVVRQISLCQGSGCTTASSTVMTRTVILCHPGDLLHDVC